MTGAELEAVQAAACCPVCDQAGGCRWTMDRPMPAGSRYPGHFVRHFVCACGAHWSQFLGPEVGRL